MWAFIVESLSRNYGEVIDDEDENNVKEQQFSATEAKNMSKNCDFSFKELKK